MEQAAATSAASTSSSTNASAIQLTKTPETDMKRFDLMHQVNARGTFLVSKTPCPTFNKSTNPIS